MKVLSTKYNSNNLSICKFVGPTQRDVLDNCDINVEHYEGTGIQELYYTLYRNTMKKFLTVVDRLS